jgi:nucleotide-binding universal stress UspA family protein
VKIKNILVPHTGTSLGDKALSYATHIARSSGATVNILHVVEPLPGPPLFVFSKSESKQIRNELEGITNALVKDIREGLKARADFCKAKNINANYLVVKGRPEDEILNYTKNHRVDLVVMAKRRKLPGMSGILKLGSVSRKVLEAVNKPILIIE